MIARASARAKSVCRRESFFRMAATRHKPGQRKQASRMHLARRGHSGHSLTAGTSQPPREMAIPFERCSLFFWSGHMDGFPLELSMFLLATFAGALVAVLSGFAFGLVVAAIWLYILTPLQTATLIIAFGLHRAGLFGLEAAPLARLAKLWPFVVGAALGVPVGVGILTWANPAHVRAGVGAFLVLYSLYALLRPAIPAVKAAGAAADRGCRLPQRRARRHHRACRNPRDHLVRLARLVQGRAARGVSADGGGDLRSRARCGSGPGARSRLRDQTVPDRMPALFAGTWLGTKLFGRLNEALPENRAWCCGVWRPANR